MDSIVVAAPASGQGKTTVTLALMAALRRRGLAVAPFKVGPDFIDPGHHGRVCGRPSRNLDGWMCGEERVRQTHVRGCAGADLAVIEGVMGLFDGASGDSDEGSTAEIARWLGAPVLLVVDARSQARSAAALVQGFSTFDPRLEFAGVVFNRVGSPRHEELLREAMASSPGLPPVLGCLPRDEGLALPERHLGLVTAGDHPLDDAFLGRLADWIEDHVDIEKFLARPQSPCPEVRVAEGRVRGNPGEVRIAVARDEAFCFYYPENLELLEAAGAQLAFFSPLRDEFLPADIGGLYLGGGYPELHAERIAANRGLLRQIRDAAEGGLPVYAECGGFMLLAEEIDGHPMAGVFPARARMLKRRRALGYREVTLTADAPLGPAGTAARGHEFHYSELEMPEAVERAYRMSRRGGEDLGPEGYHLRNVLGSYVHLHFGSNPQVAANFVAFCRDRAGA
ncbi:MAG: cobyrinic acid a,c-diamide synthase [Desulfuromonas sp.]|uniref:cobyrinate a,c-diamide synthase n=1 Tax=Desulfuromonas sp. TaxID=892 RepID=UPI000CAB0D57|nr:cobyrinate a,c-diamide synthase [Desulfuromonas sp.]PLX83742.1 MAG: cobyrinic acid a,c-diamide synthase [Desulfuromonas sp.]